MALWYVDYSEKYTDPKTAQTVTVLFEANVEAETEALARRAIEGFCYNQQVHVIARNPSPEVHVIHVQRLENMSHG